MTDCRWVPYQGGLVCVTDHAALERARRTPQKEYDHVKMNRFDVEETAQRWLERQFDLPNLAAMALALLQFMQWVDGNSDGWPYWSRPHTASAKLQDFLEMANAEHRKGERSVDISIEDCRRLTKPIETWLLDGGLAADGEMTEERARYLMCHHLWDHPWPPMSNPTPEQFEAFVKNWPDRARVTQTVTRFLEAATVGSMCREAQHDQAVERVSWLGRQNMELGEQLTAMKQQNQGLQAIERMISRYATHRAEAIEVAASKALEKGRYGVLVCDYYPPLSGVHAPDGPAFTVEISEDVPFGEIHYRNVYASPPVAGGGES